MFTTEMSRGLFPLLMLKTSGLSYPGNARNRGEPLGQSVTTLAPGTSGCGSGSDRPLASLPGEDGGSAITMADIKMPTTNAAMTVLLDTICCAPVKRFAHPPSLHS